MRKQDPETIIDRHKGKDVLMDSNLLLLWVIGDYDPKIIHKCKRVKQFEEKDYYILIELLTSFKKIITLPNVLTEVSNLLRISLEGKWKEEVFSKFKERIGLLPENFCPSITGANCKHFLKIGLTDSVIVEIARRDLLVLTEDILLIKILQDNNIDAVNFNHIRSYYWE